jgi:hypothetical protein
MYAEYVAAYPKLDFPYGKLRIDLTTHFYPRFKNII